MNLAHTEIILNPKIHGGCDFEKPHTESILNWNENVSIFFGHSQELVRVITLQSLNSFIVAICSLWVYLYRWSTWSIRSIMISSSTFDREVDEDGKIIRFGYMYGWEMVFDFIGKEMGGDDYIVEVGVQDHGRLDCMTVIEPWLLYHKDFQNNNFIDYNHLDIHWRMISIYTTW